MATYVLVGGAWLGAGVGRGSPGGCEITATTALYFAGPGGGRHSDRAAGGTRNLRQRDYRLASVSIQQVSRR
jgi:hypothetical protein